MLLSVTKKSAPVVTRKYMDNGEVQFFLNSAVCKKVKKKYDLSDDYNLVAFCKYDDKFYYYCFEDNQFMPSVEWENSLYGGKYRTNFQPRLISEDDITIRFGKRYDDSIRTEYTNRGECYQIKGYGGRFDDYVYLRLNSDRKKPLFLRLVELKGCGIYNTEICNLLEYFDIFPSIDRVYKIDVSLKYIVHCK